MPAFSFLAEPADIVDGNFKLTLGLLQQLVNHYPLKSVTPKNSFNKAMLAWFQAFLPEKDIPDFTTAWNDGVLLTLLIDKLKPGVLTNHSLLDSREATNLAITTAEKSFEIPQVRETLQQPCTCDSYLFDNNYQRRKQIIQ
jgi:filamin